MSAAVGEVEVSLRDEDVEQLLGEDGGEGEGEQVLESGQEDRLLADDDNEDAGDEQRIKAEDATANTEGEEKERGAEEAGEENGEGGASNRPQGGGRVRGGYNARRGCGGGQRSPRGGPLLPRPPQMRMRGPPRGYGPRGPPLPRYMLPPMGPIMRGPPGFPGPPPPGFRGPLPPGMMRAHGMRPLPRSRGFRGHSARNQMIVLPGSHRAAAAAAAAAEDDTVAPGEEDDNSVEMAAPETSSTGPTPLMSIRTPTQVQAAVHQQKEKERMMAIRKEQERAANLAIANQHPSARPLITDRERVLNIGANQGGSGRGGSYQGHSSGQGPQTTGAYQISVLLER